MRCASLLRIVIDSSQNRPVVVERVSNADYRIDEKLSLPAGGIALYLLDLNSLANAESKWRELLSSDERERSVRFHFQRDRQRYCATRAILRTLLGAYLQTAPHQLSFQYSDKGKPGLAASYRDRLAFNVSHSGEFALLGFAQFGEIGVDIEEVRDDFDSAAIARRFFSAREQEQL